MAGVSVKVDIDWSKLEGTKSQVKAAISQGVTDLAKFGLGKAKQYSPVKTGHLRRSIHLLRRGKYSSGYSTAIKYAAIQEFGNKKPIQIKPRNNKALKIPFKGAPGGFIFRKSATIPKGAIKAKRYMQRSGRDLRRNANRIMKEALKT